MTYPSQRSRKPVTFARKSELTKQVEAEWSPNCVKSMWYTDEDYDAFLDHCECTVLKMEKGVVLKDKKHSSEGLEYWIKEEGDKRRERRRRGYDAVWQQQKRAVQSTSNGVEVGNYIARAYHRSTNNSRCIAFSKGKQTEREVRRYLQRTLNEELLEFCAQQASDSLGKRRLPPKKKTSVL